jgi:hypothetical protein
VAGPGAQAPSRLGVGTAAGRGLSASEAARAWRPALREECHGHGGPAGRAGSAEQTRSQSSHGAGCLRRRRTRKTSGSEQAVTE